MYKGEKIKIVEKLIYKKKILYLTGISIISGFINKSYSAFSDDLLPPLSCKDILFRAMPLSLDKDGDRIFGLCYTLCMHNNVLKDKLAQTVEVQERQSLVESMTCIEKLIQVAIIAFRAHYFVFGPMKFRQFICEKQLSGQKE
ncbi:hypothetical protein [Holospora curviuscula]|uniref:Uncharacterized protein n=1 Tax=Holospora curviuscula TaxID=1082868 RepID=A0A2S5R9Q3_9PROT|nr:hypothetical protein [Holospora curviuscula]PPE04059.1 hypothetical protein HCUR_00594 [Holospora curviuscula]